MSLPDVNLRLMLPELRTRRLASADLLHATESHNPVGLSVLFSVKLNSEVKVGGTDDEVLSMVPPGWKKASPFTFARVRQVFTFTISRR